jgi:hypothetical protein
MNKNGVFYTGLNPGDKYSYIIILDQKCELIEESRQPWFSSLQGIKGRNISASILNAASLLRPYN